jgi:hypothetical protein
MKALKFYSERNRVIDLIRKAEFELMPVLKPVSLTNFNQEELSVDQLIDYIWNKPIILFTDSQKLPIGFLSYEERMYAIAKDKKRRIQINLLFVDINKRNYGIANSMLLELERTANNKTNEDTTILVHIPTNGFKILRVLTKNKYCELVKENPYNSVVTLEKRLTKETIIENSF